MTLDPVFRSEEAVRSIIEIGFIDQMEESIQGQRDAISYIHNLLFDILDEKYIIQPPSNINNNVHFLQNNFFLIIFRSILATIGIPYNRLQFYTSINYCIKGLITCGDNIFDDESKSLLPIIQSNNGSKFSSILELLCFDRLVHKICHDAIDQGYLTKDQALSLHKNTLGRLANIGTLEGSEERGVEKILPVEEMVEKVHKIRGGQLFSLALIAPFELEEYAIQKKLEIAKMAIEDLGTAFQLVDDLTDFEFDLKRKSHNILISTAYYDTNSKVQDAISNLLSGHIPEMGMVEGIFLECAHSVLSKAKNLGRSAFQKLEKIGFWFPSEQSDILIEAIVGIEGSKRIQHISSMK